jgi:hypothetical protein
MNGMSKMNISNLSETERSSLVASLQLSQVAKDAGNLSLETLSNDPNGALSLVQRVPELKKLTITITNGESTAQNAVLFDLYSINGLTEGTVTKAVSGGIDYSDVNEIIALSNLLVVGFRLQVPASSDFSRTVLFKRSNLDGTINEQANVTQLITAAQNPNYLQANFVFVPFVRIIDVYSGLQASVAPGATTFTFYVAIQDRNS